MTFQPGAYRFIVARHCQDAYRNAIRLLGLLNVRRDKFEARLGDIQSSVQQGRRPYGAFPVSGMAGYYAMSAYSISIVFSVDETPPRIILIEEIDAGELAAALDDAHSLGP